MPAHKAARQSAERERGTACRTLKTSSGGSLLQGSPPIDIIQTLRNYIAKARRRLRVPETTGRVVAELSFDFWRFLLVRRHEATIWRALRRQGMPNYPQPQARQPFEDRVDRIYKLRKRIAHHEPLIHLDATEEVRRLDRLSADLYTLARWIDPAAADWIVSVSRVVQIRQSRP